MKKYKVNGIEVEANSISDAIFKAKDSINDARALSVSGWQFKDNELVSQNKNANILLANGDIKNGKKQIEYCLHNVRECLDQARELERYAKNRQAEYRLLIDDIDYTRKHYNIV